MRLTTAIQEALITLACFGTREETSLVFSLVQPKTYDTYYRDIALSAREYFDKYNASPGEHTLDLIDVLKERNPDNKEIYDSIYESLLDTKDGINSEYVISQAQSFSRYQNLKLGISTALDLLQAEKLNEAESALNNSMKQTSNLFDSGTMLSDTSRALRFLDIQDNSFACGIPEIDSVGLGPARKRLHLFMALSGYGKSWWAVHLAKTCMMQRLKVLYVTLELSEEEVTQRVFQSLFSIAKRKQTIPVNYLEKDELGRFINLEPGEIVDRPYLGQEKIRSYLVSKMKKFGNKFPLIVKEFPTGSLTIRELKAYLDMLESAKNFIPDIIIIDYADLMKIDKNNQRVEIGELYKDLRGIAMERNVAMATLSQSNRSGIGRKVLTAKHTSEDISKISTSDIVITFNQTVPGERDLGLARLYVEKGRTDKDKFTVLISQAYASGQFCLDSCNMTSDYWSRIELMKDEQEDE